MSKLESETAYKLNRRIIQNFIDIIILKHLRNNHPMSGYDIIRHLHKKFHILQSSGTIYSMLYSLEREKLIEGKPTQRKRTYKLTNQGEKFLNEIQAIKGQIQTLLSSVFSEV